MILYHLVDEPESLATLRGKRIEKEKAGNNNLQFAKLTYAFQVSFLILCNQGLCCGESGIRSGMLALKIDQTQLLLLRKMLPL